MMKAARPRGAELRIGRITSVMRRANTGRVAGVVVHGEQIDGDVVVIAMAPGRYLWRNGCRCPLYLV
jgi:hypothetical protein